MSLPAVAQVNAVRKSGRFAWVEFRTLQAAQAAMLLDGGSLGTATINVSASKTPMYTAGWRAQVGCAAGTQKQTSKFKTKLQNSVEFSKFKNMQNFIAKFKQNSRPRKSEEWRGLSFVQCCTFGECAFATHSRMLHLLGTFCIVCNTSVSAVEQDQGAERSMLARRSFETSLLAARRPHGAVPPGGRKRGDLEGLGAVRDQQPDPPGAEMDRNRCTNQLMALSNSRVCTRL